MITPLFQAKFSPPPVRPRLVFRPRLHALLDQGLECRLTLVSAPAGYGKTTLLAEWAASTSLPVAWLALDADDNDPSRFNAGFLAALKRACPSAPWPDPASLFDLPPQAALQRLLFSLEGESQPLVLVLDDLHLLRDPHLFKALAVFIDCLPPHLHLYLATRKDPPIPLARMRAQGELVEVRARQLRFSIPESVEFLERKMGLRLPEDSLTVISERTEGWVAGLQLAALSLTEHDDPQPFIQSISGGHRFILDYLVEEVLEAQPPEIHTFLLRTSILRRLSTSLCAALLEGEVSVDGETLAQLERANLFLTPLDAERQWYRYHHLFADLLQRRLLEIHGPELCVELHRRASAWYHQAGDPVEALYHIVKTGDWPAAAHLMELWGEEFLKTGTLGTYLQALRSLPLEELQRHPQLLQDMGWGLALTNDLESAGGFFRQAEKLLSDQPVEVLADNLAGQAYVACFQFDLPRARALGRRALELLEPENIWMRSVASMVLGLANWFTGDIPASKEAMLFAANSAQRVGGQRVMKLALAYLGKIRVLELDFRGAEEALLSAIGSDSQPQLSPGNDVPGFDLAALYTEWNDLEAAHHYLELGMAANELNGNQVVRVAGLRTLARLRQAQGRADEAWSAVQQAVALVDELQMGSSFQNLNAACCVELSLAQGDFDRAEEWAQRISGPQGLDAFHPIPCLSRARLLIERGRSEEAMRLLAELEPLTDGPAWRYARFRLRLLQARADPQHVSSWLAPEFHDALAQNLTRSFIDQGRPLAAVLRALPPPPEPELAARLANIIEACGGGFSSRSAGTVSLSLAEEPLPTLVEALSERELEVLTLIAAGQSTSTIAASLYIAESTVRTHIKNIFEKLSVHSRLQAVEQARRRGLI